MKTDSHPKKRDEPKVLDKREDHQNERTHEHAQQKPGRLVPRSIREIRAFHSRPHEADGVNSPGHPGQAPPVDIDPADDGLQPVDPVRPIRPQPAQRGRPASAVTGEPLAVDLVEMTSKPLQHLPSGYVCRLSIELPEDIRAVHFDAIQGWLDSCVEVLARSSEVFRLERPSGSAP